MLPPSMMEWAQWNQPATSGWLITPLLVPKFILVRKYNWEKISLYLSIYLPIYLSICCKELAHAIMEADKSICVVLVGLRFRRTDDVAPVWSLQTKESQCCRWGMKAYSWSSPSCSGRLFFFVLLGLQLIGWGQSHYGGQSILLKVHHFKS